MPARPAPTIRTLTCSRGMGSSWDGWLTGETLSTACRVRQLLVETPDAVYRNSRADDRKTPAHRQRTWPSRHPRQRRRPRARNPRDGREAARGAAAERDLGRRPRKRGRNFPSHLLLLLALRG